MEPENIPFGKRLKSSEPETMFFNYPGSMDTETLPAGKPSPVIDSYILQGGGYYALKRNGKANLYVKDSDRLQVVPKDAPDESGYFASLLNPVKDFFVNTDKDLQKPFYYFGLGAKETYKDAQKYIPSAENLKSIIKWIAVPLAIIFTLMIINNLTD